MKSFRNIIIESKVKVGDELNKGGRKGKVIKIDGDMAQVDFGSGDVYGIMLNRIKGKNISESSQEKAVIDAYRKESKGNQKNINDLHEAYYGVADNMRDLLDEINKLNEGTAGKFGKDLANAKTAFKAFDKLSMGSWL
jgi:hypothetical protein